MKKNVVNVVLVFAVAEMMAHAGKGFFAWEHWVMVLLAIALIFNKNRNWRW